MATRRYSYINASYDVWQSRFIDAAPRCIVQVVLRYCNIYIYIYIWLVFLDVDSLTMLSHLLLLDGSFGERIRCEEIQDGWMGWIWRRMRNWNGRCTFFTRKPAEGPDEGVYLVIIRRSPVRTPFAPRGVLGSLTAVLRPPLAGWPDSSECRIYFLHTSRSAGGVLLIGGVHLVVLICLFGNSQLQYSHSLVDGYSCYSRGLWVVGAWGFHLSCVCFDVDPFVQHAYERLR